MFLGWFVFGLRCHRKCRVGILPLVCLGWTGFAFGVFRRFGSGKWQRLGFSGVGRVEWRFFLFGFELIVVFNPFEADV